MALAEFQHRELTEADKLFIFKKATAGMSGWQKRWAGRAAIPMTDAQLAEALAFEIGDGGGGGPDIPDTAYAKSGLRIWGGWTYPRQTDEPLWKGAATIAMAREIYGIKTPEQFAEPSLFDAPIASPVSFGEKASNQIPSREH
jgi:hypothetical protein